MKKRNNQTTSKKVKFKGTESFINAATGEVVEMQVTDIEERDFNFHKLWLKNIINTLDLVGNQKTRLAFWIIEHLDKENQLTFTYRQIVDEYKKSEEQIISLQTVMKTMQILMDSNFLRRKNSGCYIVNPDVVFKGTRTGRLNVLNQFHKVEHIEMTPEDELKALSDNIDALKRALDVNLEKMKKLQESRNNKNNAEYKEFR